MEWKQGEAQVFGNVSLRLGNFLSGMETAKRCGIQEGAVGLGNFLSGMETGIRSLPERSTSILGNFLSGMETEKDAGHRA